MQRKNEQKGRIIKHTQNEEEQLNLKKYDYNLDGEHNNQNEKKIFFDQSIQCDQEVIEQSILKQQTNPTKGTTLLNKAQGPISSPPFMFPQKKENHSHCQQEHQSQVINPSLLQQPYDHQNSSLIKGSSIHDNHNQNNHKIIDSCYHNHHHQQQQSIQTNQQYNGNPIYHNDNSNKRTTLIRQILKFHQVIKPKVKTKKSLFQFQQLTTKTNFGKRYNSSKNNSNIRLNENNSHLKSSTLRNSSINDTQNSRWLKSQSYMQQKQFKRSLHQSLIKSYHKHESKHFANLQKYMKAFIQFQDNLINQPFRISLLNTFEEIKQQMETYLENSVVLENMSEEKPSYQWTQEKLTNFFTQYKPVFLPKQSVNSLTQKLTLKKYKNCVYFGHMINGKKQGQGVIYYFNGKVFQGRFKNDQKMFGFQIEPEEYEIYIGEFEKGIRHGIGMLKNNEHLLWGRFTKGQFQSQAQQNSQINLKQQPLTKKDFVTRNHFNKKVKNNNLQKHLNKEGFKLTFNSIVVYTSKFMIVKNMSNDIFIGNYNQQTQQKHGEGLQIFMNGDLYIGNYESNTPQQYGEYYWASGAFYRGQFLSGMRHGKGKWQMLHGDSYEGEYMNDKKNGQGIYHWKNGSKYIGAFQNDYRHGYGEMQWNDRRIYKGQWINGIEKNVTIQLDNGANKVSRIKSTFNTISVTPGQKKTPMSKRYNLPSVQKKQMRSVSNPSTRNSYQTADSSLPVRKKITLQNIKALYNPSNH